MVGMTEKLLFVTIVVSQSRNSNYGENMEIAVELNSETVLKIGQDLTNLESSPFMHIIITDFICFIVKMTFR